MKHSKYSIVNYFIRQAMEDKDLTIFGDGNQLRDYIYVEDLARAFILAAVDDVANGQTFNVGSGIGIKFKDMVKAVTNVVGKGRIKHVPWPVNYFNVETGDYVTDITKISDMLSWRPETNFEEAVEKTLRYYEKYSKHYF
jgi:UDP-glucose 4-epimerase